jgi:hypothetical protein
LTKHNIEVSGIQTHQTEEIDPRNVSLPESDEEDCCVGGVVDPGEGKRTDEDADADVLPLFIAGRPEIAKVRNQNSSSAFPDC